MMGLFLFWKRGGLKRRKSNRELMDFCVEPYGIDWRYFGEQQISYVSLTEAKRVRMCNESPVTPSGIMGPYKWCGRNPVLSVWLGIHMVGVRVHHRFPNNRGTKILMKATRWFLNPGHKNFGFCLYRQIFNPLLSPKKNPCYALVASCSVRRLCLWIDFLVQMCPYTNP